MNGIYSIGLMLVLLKAIPTSNGQACNSTPCDNGALCEERGEGYSCFCVDGFTGPTCAVNFDDCLSAPCQNNATCIDGVANYTCACAQGFTGSECQGDIDECVSSPCLQNGTCINVVNGYVCACVEPYRGENCDLLPCETSPCENGAECFHDVNFERSFIGFICDCPVGFSGDRCEVDISDCSLAEDPCSGHGLCVDGVNEYSCLCEPGWAGNRCESPIDDCIDNACRNDANCTDLHLGYYCECQDGYDGALCERERNECELLKPCQNGGICIDLFDDYSCDCGTGWHGINCTEPVNECLTSPCLNGATCLDLVGDFTCRCAPFFTGSLCETQFNPCAPEHNPCQNGANCVVPPDGLYRCFCEKGYTGIHCEVNINECLLQPCENNSTCEDITAGYVCHCMPGWTGSVCEENVDDCAAKPCYNDAVCLDLVNSFECKCPREYTGRLCDQEVKFCTEDSCLNGGTCVNILGSFECLCPTFYTGKRCQNIIDACKSDPCVNNGTCLNTNDGANCICEYPYTGQWCDYTVDFCYSEPCLNGGTCIRLATGYLCVCPEFLTGRQCTDLIDYCEDEPCKNGAYCINDATKYRCSCLYGFKGLNCTEMVDFCIEGPCLNEANCSNIPGGFTCDCADGYEGTLCQNIVIVPTPLSSFIPSYASFYSDATMHGTNASISNSIEPSSAPIPLLTSSSLLSKTQKTGVPISTRSHSMTPALSTDATSFTSDIYKAFTISPSLYQTTKHSLSNQSTISYQNTIQPSFVSFVTTISSDTHDTFTVAHTQISDVPISTLVPINVSKYLTSHDSKDSIGITTVNVAGSFSSTDTRQSICTFTSLHVFTSSTWEGHASSFNLHMTLHTVHASTFSSVVSPFTKISSHLSSNYQLTIKASTHLEESTNIAENSDVITAATESKSELTTISPFDKPSILVPTSILQLSSSAPIISTKPFSLVYSDTLSVSTFESTRTKSMFTSAISDIFHSSHIASTESFYYSYSSNLDPSSSFESHASLSSTKNEKVSSQTTSSPKITHSTTDLNQFPTPLFSKLLPVSSTVPGHIEFPISKTPISNTFKATANREFTKIMFTKATDTFLHYKSVYSSSSLFTPASSDMYGTSFTCTTPVSVMTETLMDISSEPNAHLRSPLSITSVQSSTTEIILQSSISEANSQYITSFSKYDLSLLTLTTSYLSVLPTVVLSNDLITTKSLTLLQSTSQYFTSKYTSHNMDSGSASVPTQASPESSSITYVHSKPLLTSLTEDDDYSTFITDIKTTSSSYRFFTHSTSSPVSLTTLTDTTVTAIVPTLSKIVSSLNAISTNSSMKATVLRSTSNLHAIQETSSFPTIIPRSMISSLYPSFNSLIKTTLFPLTTTLLTPTKHISVTYSLSTSIISIPTVTYTTGTASIIILDSTDSPFVSIISYSDKFPSLGSFRDSPTATLSSISSEMKIVTSKLLTFSENTAIDLKSATSSLTNSDVIPSTFYSYSTTPLATISSLQLISSVTATTMTIPNTSVHTPTVHKPTTSLMTILQNSQIRSPVSSIDASSSLITIHTSATITTGTAIETTSSTSITATSASTTITTTTIKTTITTATTIAPTTAPTTTKQISTITPPTTTSDVRCMGTMCMNNGTCKEDRLGVYCDCLGGFIGRSCETETTACSTFVCENGGHCTVSLTTYGVQVPRCNCPLPFTGTRCQAELLVYFPSFLGTSFLEFQPPTFAFDQPNEINIVMKTTTAEGTIMYSSNQIPGRIDTSYVRLRLDDGKLVYEFSCDGDMEGIIVGHNYVNTGDIYAVTIRQVWPFGPGHWCSASMAVNGVWTVSRPLLALSVPQELGQLYVGGVPRQSYNDDKPMVHVMDGFVGCVRSLQVNQHEIDMVYMATGSANIENCNVPVCQHSPCRNGGTCHSSGNDWYCDCAHGYAGPLCERRLCHSDPCLHGATCVVMETERDQLCLCPYGRGGVFCETALSIDTSHYTGTQFGHTSYTAYAHPREMTDNFEAEFRLILDDNSAENNLILYMGNTDMRFDEPDFLAVGVYRGYLVFRFDLGSGYGEVYSPSPLNQSLSHHVVALGKTGTRGWLQVDDQRNVTLRSRGQLNALNTRSMLYVGGYPNDAVKSIAEPARFENGLKGCVYQLQIRAYSRDFIAPGSPPGHVEEGRNVAPCTSVSCQANTCHNGAECVDLGASIYCNCTDGWKGALCLDETTVCDVINSCADGSTCVPVLPSNYTCLCPLGKRGKHCDEEFEISDPLFSDDESYMSFEPVYIRRHADVTVQLTSYKRDGLLFYVTKRLHSVSGDFLSLSLHDWKLQLRFDVGSGLQVVRSDVTLENGTWYTIYTGRNSTHGYVTVDGHVTVAMTSGMMLYLDTTSEFYIGGIPHLSDAAPSAFENEPSGFHGCVRELVVNGRIYDLTKSGAVNGRNVGDCDGTSCGHGVCKNGGSCTSGSDVNINCLCPEEFFGERCELPVQCRDHACLHGDCRVIDTESHVCDCHVGWAGSLCDQEHVIGTSAMLAGNSYLVLTDRRYVTRNTSHTRLTLTFKSRALHALFVWHGQTFTEHEDYLGIGLQNGHVKVVWNLGWFSSDVVITTLRYNDGEWHTLTIEIIARDLVLTIDDVIYTSTVSGDFREMDTYSVYYIGGFKRGNVKESTMEFFTEPLDGCIKDLRLHNESSVVFDDVDDGVNVLGCV